MAISRVETVLTVASARAGLSRILKSFRDEPGAPPVVLGSHRKAEAVLMSHEHYRALTGPTPGPEAGPVPRESVLEQLLHRRALITRLAALGRIRSVSVFGAVAREAESAQSEVDLLVETQHDATPADLAQFAADMQQLCGRPIDLVDARSLLIGADGGIRAEAVRLTER